MKKIFYILFAVCIVCKPPTPVNAQERFFVSSISQSYLLGEAGQSNSLGIAPLAGLQAGLSGIKVNQKIYEYISNSFVSLQAGVTNAHKGSGNATYFGDEMRLMSLMQSAYGGTQYLTKFAIGGTSMLVDWNPNSTAGLFDQSTTYELAAKAASGLKFKAYIWTQGEADAQYSSPAAGYEALLISFINKKRTVLGQPNMPFIIVSLSNQQSSASYPYLSVVKAAQQAVAASLTNVYYIEQNNVTSDGSHYTAAGYDAIAYQIFNIIKTLP